MWVMCKYDFYADFAEEFAYSVGMKINGDVAAWAGGGRKQVET